VAAAVQVAVGDTEKVFCDPACIESGNKMRLPLFAGEKSSAARMCNVDLLVIVGDQVQIIIEIDESSIRPTQIFGKFLQAVASDYFSLGGRKSKRYPLADDLLFLQVLDGSRLHPTKSRKLDQAKVISARIGELMSHKSGLKYHALYWKGTEECECLQMVGEHVRNALT
jgi:hypothetical protein